MISIVRFDSLIHEVRGHKVRIISARLATNKERRIYEEG